MKEDDQILSFIKRYYFLGMRKLVLWLRCTDLMNACKDRREIIHVFSSLLMSHFGLKHIFQRLFG